MPAITMYQPSGRLDRRLLPQVVLVGLPLLALLGWGYANALLYNPPVLIAPLVNGFFALLCGVVAAWVVEKGHSRSLWGNTVVAVFLTGIFIWVRWLVTFRAMDVAAAMQFFQAPLAIPGMLWELAVAEAQADSRAFSPVMHCLVWLLEVFLPALLMIFLCRTQARSPYSETLGIWASKEAGGELYPEYRLAEALLPELAADGIQSLLRMPRADRMHADILASAWTTLKVVGHQAEADPSARWLDIELLSHQRDNEGKVKVARSDLLKGWHVSPEDYGVVMTYCRGDALNPPLTESAPESAPPTPAALQPALAALESGDFDQAVRLATPHRQHPVPAVQADALRLCALARSNLAHWPAAFADFHELFDREATAHNALQLATTSVMAGELERGVAWFERADMLNRESGDMPPGQLRTGFLSALEQAGQIAACLPHLEWLARAYRALSVSDSHVVWSHGLPFLGDFLDKSLPLLRELLPEIDIPAWYQAMREDLDDEGRATIDTFLQTRLAVE